MPTMTELLSKPQNLPSVPEVVRELIQSFNEPEPDLLLIAGKVAKDPVLSAKLLRLANSAKFGCSRQIATVKEAAVRLGTDSVRNMVLACSLTGSLKTVPGIDLKHFWAHVFDVAALAKQLSKTQGNKGEEVFTCALLYDLGRLIMHLGLPENLVLRICDLEPHKGRAAAEQAVVGFTYADVGAELAKQWNFPDSFCRASAVCFICLRSLPCVGDSINPFSYHVNRFILTKTPLPFHPPVARRRSSFNFIRPAAFPVLQSDTGACLCSFCRTRWLL